MRTVGPCTDARAMIRRRVLDFVSIGASRFLRSSCRNLPSRLLDARNALMDRTSSSAEGEEPPLSRVS